MKKSKSLTYFIIFSLFAAGLITSCLFPALNIMERAKTNDMVIFSEHDIFLNIMADHSNYLSYNIIMVFYLLAFALGLGFVFFKDKPSFILRLKSRNDYVKKHIIDILIFSSVFTFLLEVINVIFSFAVFGYDMTINSGLIPYSAIDLITEFLFYMRVGIVLLVTGIIVNKKFAPFITFGIYFLEYFSSNRIGSLFYGIWLPYKDSVYITNLIMGYTQPVDVIPAIIRGILMNGALIFTSYYLFKKKDIIGNEKK